MAPDARPAVSAVSVLNVSNFTLYPGIWLGSSAIARQCAHSGAARTMVGLAAALALPPEPAELAEPPELQAAMTAVPMSVAATATTFLTRMGCSSSSDSAAPRLAP